MLIPTTNVVRHWVIWDNDEQDLERGQQFDAWLKIEKDKATDQAYQNGWADAETDVIKYLRGKIVTACPCQKCKTYQSVLEVMEGGLEKDDQH
jgi:hypothetical protein